MIPIEVPPPPVESVGWGSRGRPILTPESVTLDVPLDPGSGVPLQVSFSQGGRYDNVPRRSSITDGTYIEPRTIIHVGDAHHSPIRHSEENDLVQRHVRRVSIVIDCTRPSSYRSAGVDTGTTMIEIDGAVSDYQGLASNGGKNNTSNGISDEGKRSRCSR